MSRRLLAEIKGLKDDPPTGCTLLSDDPASPSINISKIEVILNSFKGTPYEGGNFHLHINIPENYPFKPPTPVLITKIYHPNIAENGEFCIAILDTKEWSVSYTIKNVIEDVMAVIASEPNPHNPLNSVAAKDYLKNKDVFCNIARSYCKIYALKNEKQ